MSGRPLLSIKEWALGGAIVVVVVVAVMWAGSAGLRESFWAGTAATVVGILLGLPLAVSIALRQQTAERDSARAFADASRRIEADLLLEVLADDLEAIRVELNRRRPGTVQRELLMPFLGSHLLDRLGGDRLAVIDNPTTIREVSRAYDRIETTRFLEQTLYELGHDSFAGRAETQFTAEVRSQLIMQDQWTGAAIDQALSQVALYRDAHRVEPTHPQPG